jgi:hypothetical protein
MNIKGLRKLLKKTVVNECREFYYVEEGRRRRDRGEGGLGRRLYDLCKCGM